jgi:dTDP-4-dehydrorhamnose reductase
MIGRAGMDKGVVAIFGGRGMLGSDLAVACTERGYDVCVGDVPEFDITDAAQVRERVGAADAVINCAAYTDVDGAEEHRDVAHRVNGDAVGQLGAIARESGKWVLHFSTDFVFDGKLDRPYTEADRPHPINEYGRSKMAGERLLTQSGCRHCIVRLEWMYGAHGDSFVRKLVRRARTSEHLSVVDDQVGSPTATTEVSKMACELLDRRLEGLFHFASAGYVSRFGVAQFVFDRLSLQTALSPCRSTDYPTPAERPLNSRFNCAKIQAALAHPIRPWQGPLEGFLRRL